LPLRPRRAFARLGAVPHGGLDANELAGLGIDPAGVLDFSVSTNPFMPPPGTKELLSAVPVERYPDSSSTVLRRKLSERLGVPAGNIVVGSGTTELIRLLAGVYLRRGDTALVLEPTYGEYEAAVRLAGARVLKHRAAEKDNFSPDIAAMAGLVAARRPGAVFICHPNNPTGRYFSCREIEILLENLGDGLLVLDEAYVAFVEKSWNSIPLTDRGNVVVLRSMTKDYGLPGLRLGYAVARREIVAGLRPALPPWNVNIAAQELGAAMLEKDEYLEQSLRRVREAARFLAGELSRLGFTVLPSDAHYFLVKVGDAAACRRSLLEHGCLVRDCTSFGLPAHVRIAPRALPECRKLVDAFAELLKEGVIS
jgi:histidinol-phosphate aminotransferase